MELGGKKILVLGLGISGMAAAELALNQKASVTVIDSSDGSGLRERAAKLRQLGAETFLASDGSHVNTSADLAVISPGIHPDSPLGQLASSLPCPVISELAFGARFCQCPILAITGTNGKTTTVELTVHCLRALGLRVEAAGNCGYPLSTASTVSSDLDWLVVEVSSFQLEHADGFKPYGAACLNISSDHQDRYQTFTDYVLTKRKLIRAVDNPTHTVLGCSLLQHSEFRNIPHPQPGRQLIFCCSPMADADFTCDSSGYICSHSGTSGRQLIHRDELALKGSHNVENVMAALALCRIAGVDEQAAAQAAASFHAGEHRLELVGEYNGVRYINDSKATNPDAMIQAIKACSEETDGRIILIAGGRDKSMQFDAVTPWLRHQVSNAILLGETREVLNNLWNTMIDCETAKSLDQAVDKAITLAQPGDTVMLSPGCASQDMFSNYAERGKTFKNALNRRLGKMTNLIAKGTGLSAAAAVAIAMLSGCSSTQQLSENTKTVEEKSRVSSAFSNRRGMFSLKDINKRPKVAVNPKTSKISFLPPPKISTIKPNLTNRVKPLPTPRSSNLTYQVKKGDTLSHIAVAHKVGVGELAALNGMNKDDILYVGKMLKIPAGGVKPRNGVHALRDSKVDYYTVKKGDILGRIAIRNKTTVKKLKEWNGLTDDKIFVGQKLALGPGGKLRSNRGGVKITKRAIPANGIHEVKSGQSLSTIAYRYGMSVSELKRLNGLSTSHIVPGQKLFLRKGASNGTVASAKKRIQSDRTDLRDGDKYTVQSGDSLSKIASRFGVAYKKIMKANGLTSTVLMPGTTLVIPTAGTKPGPTTDVSKVVKKKMGPASIAKTDVVAKKSVDVSSMTKLPHFVDQQNDTLDVIAEMYGSKAEWIIAANPGISGDQDLRSVKEISVPVKDLGL